MTTAAMMVTWPRSESGSQRRSATRARTNAVSNMACLLHNSTRTAVRKNRRPVTDQWRPVTKLVRDPQLEELVKELNRSEPPAQTAVRDAAESSWPPAVVPAENPIEPLLSEMAQREANDLLVLAGTKPIFRISGRLAASEYEALSADEVQTLLKPFLTRPIRERLSEEGSADFSVRLA